MEWSGTKRPIVCIFFDLETTGLNTSKAEIIEIGACGWLWTQKTWLELPANAFRILVRPTGPVPRAVTRLTGITREQLTANGRAFPEAILAWRSWLVQLMQAATERQYGSAVAGSRAKETGPEGSVVGICMVGHNAFNFDIPMLAAQQLREQRQGRWPMNLPATGLGLFEGALGDVAAADTLVLSRMLAKQHYRGYNPPSHRFGVLHKYLLGRRLYGAHTALGDANGLAKVCCNATPIMTSLTALLARGCRSVPQAPVREFFETFSTARSSLVHGCKKRRMSAGKKRRKSERPSYVPRDRSPTRARRQTMRRSMARFGFGSRERLHFGGRPQSWSVHDLEPEEVAGPLSTSSATQHAAVSGCLQSERFVSSNKRPRRWKAGVLHIPTGIAHAANGGC
mmetsp:Transcript_17609/g.40740  ORF Transcript_17609/g.40740 Transcript_17609/m.40740 type:complete len:397 (+) Transcript_17609:179-1369(+)